MVHDAKALLYRLRAQGFELVAAGDRIRFRPRTAMTPELAAEVVQLKPALLSLLKSATDQDFFDLVTRTFDAREVDPTEPDLVWSEIDLALDSAECRTCGGVARWRLRRTSTGDPGQWTCPRCHPPLPPDGKVEWRTDDGSSSGRTTA